MTSAPRVVLDTNVVLSALLFANGRLAPLRAGWQREAFHPLASAPTTEELVRALTDPKFKLTPAEQRELLGDYLPYCTAVRMPARMPKLPRCRDPFDVAFLQLTSAGKAEYLVTGDKDLLAVKGAIRFRIITQGQLLSAIATRRE